MKDLPIIYCCPYCGRTVMQPRICTYTVNTTCGPHYDESGEEFLVQMILVEEKQ